MPVQVQGPDQRVYSFPDGTNKAAAIAYFKKKGIGVPSAEPPGFTSRLGEATGFPLTSEAWKAAQPTRREQIADALLGPAATAARSAYGYGKNLVSEGRQMVRDIPKSSTGDFLQDFARVNAPANRFVQRGVFGPVGGTGVANLGEDIDKGNIAGAGGDLLGTIINAVMLKKSGAPSATKAVNRLTAAAGKESFAPIQKTFSDLRKATAGGINEVPAETSYPYQYRPIDTSRPVSGQFYHGTKAPISDVSELDPGSHGNEQSLYGIGAYLTDDPNVAKGYSKTRGKGNEGKVLSANIDNAKLLDLEVRPPELVHKIFSSTLNQISGEFLPNTISGKQMFQQIRQAMEDEGYTSSHAQEVLQDLSVELRSVGYDGLRHQGGGAIGKTPHNVAILFPDYGVGRPLNEIVKTGKPLPPLFPGSRTEFSATQPETMDAFRSVVKNANNTVKAEADAALAPIANQPVIPTSIAQAIRDLKTPDMVKTTEGRAEIAHLEAEARKFEQPWTFAQLDSKRMRLNSDLSTFEKKAPLARYTAKKGNLNTAIDNVTANTIRDVMYPRMDAAAGKPSGFFRALKQRQGSLMQLDSQLKGRIEDLKAQTAEIQGSSRFSRENMSLHVGGSGVPRTSIYGLTNVIKKRNPLAAANKRVRMGFSTGSPTAKVYTSTLPLRSTLFPAPPSEENR